MSNTNKKGGHESAIRLLVRHYVEYVIQHEQNVVEEKERERKVEENITALFS